MDDTLCKNGRKDDFMSNIEIHMNRERAEKIPSVTDEMWNQVCDFNRELAEEFLEESTHLSKRSLQQYTSAIKIFFWWVKEKKNNKKIIDVKSKDYLKYQNWLQRRGMSESGIRFKRSVISSFNEYIMLYYEEEYPTFRNFITKQIKVNKTGFVYDKRPLTPDEYRTLCDELEKKEDWQKLAYVKFTYSTGCRREESKQLLKEVVDYIPKIKMVKIKDSEGNECEMESKSYKTHDIRCKGAGEVGKVRKLQFSEEAMEAIKKWLEVRGEDDCPYVFVSKYRKGIKQIHESTFNRWCRKTFAQIVGRRVHPHLFRESRATNLVVHSGRDMETARKLLGHESSETTKIYVIREDTNDADDAFVEF